VENAKERAQAILSGLTAAYPDAECELNFKTPFELLVATILSSQCTDKRVNAVSAVLFSKFNTPEAFAALPQEVLEREIFTCGFYHNKAKNIIAASRAIVERFGGNVPESVEELTTLPGVGRKTANVVCSVAFKTPALAVDTHVFRVAHRLGLSDGATPEKVEADLTSLFEKSDWYALHHTMIFHGRYTCKSQRPECVGCGLEKYCNYYKGEKDE
jgi:endonuclease III